MTHSNKSITQDASLPFALKVATIVIGTCLSITLLPNLAHAQDVISYTEAEQIALERFPGGHVQSIEREHEWGTLVYEVEIRDKNRIEWDLDIDAESGKILNVQRDD